MGKIGEIIMVKISEIIVVEGNYDKIRLCSAVEATVVTTDGFRIFKDKEKLEFLKSMAEKRGIIIFTDPDRAGFAIRNFIKQGIKKENIKHAYIPDIFGKERRKSTPSKEGKIGVEGADNDIIIASLIKAGATVDGKAIKNGADITKADLYNDGFSGGAKSRKKRAALLKILNLPEKMSANMLLDVLNSSFSREEYESAKNKIHMDLDFDG